MKTIFLTVAMFYLAAISYAQQDPYAVKYAKLITPELAKSQLSIISSDAYEGRETGFPGADKAAEYVANEFKTLGLQQITGGSYFYKVPFVERRVVMVLTAAGKDFNYGDDLYDYGNADNGTTTANEVVFVGYGTESEIKGTDLTGKVLIWIDEDKAHDGIKANTGSTTTKERDAVIGNLLAKKPAFILGINPEIGAVLKQFGDEIKRPVISLKSNADEHTHVLFISSAAADAVLKPSGKLSDSLISLANKDNFTPVILKADLKLTVNNIFRDIISPDVLGYLPGSDAKLKNEVLIISAHYDHLGVIPENVKGDRIYNGADDDGSGTVALLDIARALMAAKKAGHGPRRSILFLSTTGEEEGLLGSKYYAEHPVLPLENTIADLNMDMVGRVGNEYQGKPDSANYIYLLGSSMLSADLHTASENANKWYMNLKLDYKYDDPKDPNHFYRRFDSYSFAAHHVPVIAYFNGLHADYHQVSDEISKINFPLLVKRAKLVYYTAWTLANAENRPAIDVKK